jgi:2-keto-4-pentenoate hydratase/2-oxohepta-3-ene-1,7-dioic acid hydratase in catechol pathway
LATYQSDRGPRAGVIVNGALFDAADLSRKPAYATVQGILDDWVAADTALTQAAGKASAGNGRKLVDVKLRAPLPLPGDIYCAGANYKDHVAEMTPKGAPLPPDPHELGLKPWHFIKSSRSVADPGATVAIPAGCQKLDWEVELAAIIGREARGLTLENALSCVAGYTVGNDLSARDLGFRPVLPEASPFRSDWTAHKSFAGACPLGPWITPARDIPDPQNLGLKLFVNDVVKQDSHTSQMIYTLAEQIAQLTARATLYPGDIVMTGTPAGTAAAHGHYLKSGDVVRAWIEGIGDLTTRIG